MSIKEFTEEIAKGIEARVAGVKATPAEEWKNNGVVQHGIALRRNEERVAPVLYLNHWFRRLKKGELSVEDIMEQVIRLYEELPDYNIPNIDEWISAEDFIDKVSVRLVNREENRAMIAARSLVHYEIENTDLVCLFYAKIIAEEGMSGEIALTEQLLERYLPSMADSEKLYREVMERVQPDTIRLESMEKLVERLIEEITTDVSQPPLEKDFMYVLTNTSMTYGAAAILTEASRTLILEKFPDSKVTLLPVSVHETILIPTLPEEDVAALRALVLQVNRTEVSKEEILSYNVYHYDANTGKLEIAEPTESEADAE